MIVTCPSCTARYKIDEAKIQGRGAKITCPTCKHKFVVYRDGEDQPAAPAAEGPKPPSDMAKRDFRQFGIVWKVRKGIGITYDVNDLVGLRELIAEGQVDKRDVLSYDAREWRAIGEIADLEAWFWEIWQKAERGEIQRATPESEESDEEDASDAPTTIVGHGSSLADEIRKAVQEARTPAPVQERATRPAPQPTPNAAPPVLEAAPPSPRPPAPGPAPVAPAPTAQTAGAGGGNGAMIAVGVVVVLVVLMGVLYAAGVFGGAS